MNVEHRHNFTFRNKCPRHAAARTACAAVVVLSTGCATTKTTAETTRLNTPIASLFDGSLITPGTDSMSVSVVRDQDTIEIGWAVDRITVEEVGGRRLLNRTYESDDRMFGHQIRRIVDRVTLQPVSQSFTGLGRRFEIEFGPRTVSGWLEEGDPLTRHDLPLIRYAPPTINAASFDLAVRAMRLEDPDFGFVIQGYSGLTGDLMRLGARVSGTLIEPNAPEVIVIVDVDFDGVPWTFFVGRESRRLIRMRWESPLGTVLYQNVTVD